MVASSTTFSVIAITQSASFGGDSSVSATEAGSGGFTVAGTGSVSNGSVKAGNTFSVTLEITTTGGSVIGTQTFTATVLTASPTTKTFTWSCTDTNLATLLGANGGAYNILVTSFGGSAVTSPSVGFAYACFAGGTRITVPAGEVAVEALRIGDLVMTGEGTAKPVKWVGRRGYTAGEVAANPYLQPVLVRRDAIAPGMPHRDLMLSPNHALFIDGVFVPAGTLVNGVSILRCGDLAAVAYYHIETDAQDVVFAEGMPAETFVDDDSRLMFDNADEYFELYGADDVPATFGGTRLEEGVRLETLRRRLAARAGAAPLPASTGALRGNVERIEDGVLHGWIAGEAASAPVEIEVLVDGEVVARTIANRYRVDLDHAGIAHGCAGFTVALPASAETLEQVAVRRAGDGVRIGGQAAAQAV
jgi:hypothetical protein